MAARTRQPYKLRVLSTNGERKLQGSANKPTGATLCTFSAFSLVPTNAVVESPHGGPSLFPFVAVYPGAFQPLCMFV